MGVKTKEGVAPFRVVERARWSDVDAAGIVCYGAYLRFFELAETELFRSLGLPVRTVPERYGVWFVRRRVECDFYRPVFLDDELHVFVHVAAVGRTSIELRFLARLAGSDELVAESRYVLVAVERDQLAAMPLPDGLRDAFTRALIAPDEARAALDSASASDAGAAEGASGRPDRCAVCSSPRAKAGTVPPDEEIA